MNNETLERLASLSPQELLVELQNALTSDDTAKQRIVSVPLSGEEWFWIYHMTAGYLYALTKFDSLWSNKKMSQQEKDANLATYKVFLLRLGRTLLVSAVAKGMYEEKENIDGIDGNE